MNASTIQDLTETMQTLSHNLIALSIAIGKENRLGILGHADDIVSNAKWIQDLAGRDTG